MIVSWNWLKDYVTLKVSAAEATERLMMAGLNHEETEEKSGDFAIDLEITSNRPDCLGHIGVARELAVLYGAELKQHNPQPKEGATAAASLAKVTVQAPALCPKYTARVIRGVKVGPSPKWLSDKLTAIGQPLINNVVDITNYVLHENGQPLHAFDLAKLRGQEIIVREAKAGEEFVAINHKTYKLEAGMCVIADSERPVALGGVMGGADSEVSGATTDVLIEAADFEPLSIRSTARKLDLRSDSSFRFERGVDPQGIDWASRRACELILDLAGGELAAGVISVGAPAAARPAIVLRFSQLKRILGIEVPAAEVRRILVALGNTEKAQNANTVEVIPPSWRRDLDREVDLVEEVARIHGYEKIPEDVSVPMVASHRSDHDRALGRVRQTLVAAGFDEAFTESVVPEDWSKAFSAFTSEEPLVTLKPMLKGAAHVRRSLVPSLLACRGRNERLGNTTVELFETAKIYLPKGSNLPGEELMLGLASGAGFLKLKGVLETVVSTLNPEKKLAVKEFTHDLFETGKACSLELEGQLAGVLGDVSAAGKKRFELRGNATVAELRLAPLIAAAVLIPKLRPVSEYPGIDLDLNLIASESLRWAELERTVRSAAGDLLESLSYKETYRDVQKDGPGKKRLLFAVVLRSPARTLTSDEAERVRSSIVSACATAHGAQLLT